MGQTCRTRARQARGGARLNFLIFMAIIIVGGYVGYQLVPVFYRASLLQTYMQDTVNNAAVLSKSPGWVEQQIRANGDDYGLPKDAQIETTNIAGHVETRVQFTRTIPLIVTTYNYKFDHTAKSAGFISGG
ncbi:MAG TPA: hypothetical protein VF525_00130 [Pyrinomonadaceae bacterium]|jgi:hypothetical protein